MFLEAGILLFTIFLLIKLFRRNDGIDIPGPRPWPIFGNALQLDPEKPHLMLDKWNKEYNGFYKFYLKDEPVVALGTPELAHEMYVKLGNISADRHDFYRLDLWSDNADWRDGIIFSPSDPTWKKLRQVIHKFLKQYAIGLHKIEEVTLEVRLKESSIAIIMAL